MWCMVLPVLVSQNTQTFLVYSVLNACESRRLGVTPHLYEGVQWGAGGTKSSLSLSGGLRESPVLGEGL